MSSLLEEFEQVQGESVPLFPCLVNQTTGGLKRSLRFANSYISWLEGRASELAEGQKPTTNSKSMQLPDVCPDPNCGCPIKVVAHHSAQCQYCR